MIASRKLRILVPIAMISILLCACKSKQERLELTNYIGRSVASFERGTKTELTEDSNSVFVKQGIVQVMAPEKKIKSVMLLKGAKDYTIHGIGIGMNQKDAQPKLQKVFGDKISDSPAGDNAVTYHYEKESKELYITFDTNKSTVVEMSYYNMNEENKDNKEKEGNDAGMLIAMIGDRRVYYNEAMVYLKSAQEKYESMYGNDIWGVDIIGDGNNFGNLMKAEVIKQITELKIICDKAEEQKVYLEEQDIADAKAYAKVHYDGLKAKDIDKYLITQELLEQIYMDNILASKVFENLTINVNTDIPDSEAKQITVQHIFVNGANYDSEGKKVSFTAEEKEKAYDKVKKLLKKAKDTDDFYALAKANTEAEDIEYTFGRGKGPKEYGAAFENAAFTLKTGQVSDIITTENGWHILYCKLDFDKDATIRVKEEMIEALRDEMFAKTYQEWSKEYDIVVNSTGWNQIPFEK